MSRSRAGSSAGGRAAALALALLLASSSASAAPRFRVSGSPQVLGERIEVRVDLTNEGDQAAASVSVEGRLLGARDDARIARAIGAGETHSVLLSFPLVLPRPGLHPLTLLLDSPEPGAERTLSQCAFLLLTLGAKPEPALRLAVPETPLDVSGTLTVGLESADGVAHRARLSVVTPRGLRAEPPPGLIAVPATGRVSAAIRLLRGAAPRGSRQGILVIAVAEDGELERTSIATGEVRVLPDPALMPRLRPWLFALALALLVAAVALELRALARGSS